MKKLAGWFLLIVVISLAKPIALVAIQRWEVSSEQLVQPDSTDRSIAELEKALSVTITGCPFQVNLVVPEGFTPARSYEQTKKQRELLHTLHSNSARKARYTQVLLKQWDSETYLPYILVGALGATINSQGDISTKEWAGIKEQFLRYKGSPDLLYNNNSVQEKIKQLQKGARTKIDVKSTEIMYVYEEDSTSVVMLGRVGTSIEGEDVSIISAAKLIYVSGCLAYVGIAVPAEMNSAAPDIERYVNITRVYK